MATSSAAVGVVLKAPVMPMYAVICNLVSSFTLTYFLILCHHNRAAEETIGLTIVMYIQYVIIGFRPHDLPNVALQAQKTLRALVTICCTCCFQVSPLSNISPRYLTCVNNCILLPNRKGSLMGPLFLSLVNGTTVVLLGLTKSLVMLHQFSVSLTHLVVLQIQCLGICPGW